MALPAGATTAMAPVTSQSLAGLAALPSFSHYQNNRLLFDEKEQYCLRFCYATVPPAVAESIARRAIILTPYIGRVSYNHRQRSSAALF